MSYKLLLTYRGDLQVSLNNIIPWRPLSLAKQIILPTGACARRIPLGLYRGLTLEIDFASQTQIYVGLWEVETTAVIRTALGQVEWAIDIGAGRGELAILFRRAGAACVIAAEPQAAERSAMARNMTSNGLDPTAITVIDRFIGTAGGEVAIDDLPVAPERPGFLKIDVDGQELSVIRSAERLLSEGRSLKVLVETHSARLERDCIAALQRYGFSSRIIPNAWWRAILPERRPTEHNRWLWAQKKEPRRR